MLYPRGLEKGMDPELFRHPGAEYRCTPFWAWNNDLDEELLRREIGVMQEMGMGGFHMHVRCGMSVPYLSDDFMQRIRTCVEEARKRHMLAWLYDEDKWPSGFAGGYVTEKEENRQRYLLFTPKAPVEGEGRLLARYRVGLDGAGRLAGYRRLEDGEDGTEPGEAGEAWYAVEKVSRPTAWFHFHGYADTMNPAAIRDFIRITHDRYAETLGEDLGTLCPAIFTDEPQMPRKTTLSGSRDRQDVLMPWTGDLEESYRARYGESLLDRLPELVWELPEGVSLTRYRFHDHTTERFVSAFCDQIGDWCREHGVLMTGHMMSEGSLAGQTGAVGEVMRAYRAFTLPGVDQLCDGREFITVKQAASAAHQQGCPGVTSELYGVTNWDFDFKGHKLQGDWQAALGVTVRVPHLYWVSMHGESKRDYPASIGHQSPWWKEYPFIEDHFARVNTLMTRGKPLIRIGILHPIESCWIAWGPNDLTGMKRKELDRKFEELTRWMLEDKLDFDYISESRLPDQYRPGAAGFGVGEMTYDAVIVAGMETMRRTTLEALRDFRQKGGLVIFLGGAPRYVDAADSEEAENFSRECARLPWDRVRLNEALEPTREIRILTDRGGTAENLLYAMRQDGESRNVFLCHAQAGEPGAPDREECYRVTLKGCWRIEHYDTQTGEIRPMDAETDGDETRFVWRCWGQDSLLLRLSPAEEGERSRAAREGELNGSYGIHMAEEMNEEDEDPRDQPLPPPEEILPAEDNALVLDMAEWRTDDGPWQPREEMLRIGVKAKKQLGISIAAASGAQPWALPPEKAEHRLSLRIRFRSEIEVTDARIGLEDAEMSEVTINGQKMAREPRDWYTDEAIACFPAGPIHRGENIIEITKPITASVCTENLFILGRFGVRVTGTETALIPAPKTLRYGDWTGQGLPFYSGALTYRYTIQGGGRMRLRLGRFAAPCVTVSLDGKRIGNVSLSPSEADLGEVPAGAHRLEITVYASRINTFGMLHMNNPALRWFGPQGWRTRGMEWTYTYQLKPSGLLSEPHLISR